LTGHQFFAINTKIKNLHRATPDALIFQSSSKTQTYVRRSQPATYVKHKLFSGCAEGYALLSPYDYSYNNPAPLPYHKKVPQATTDLFQNKINLSLFEQLHLEPGYYNSGWRCQTVNVHKTSFKHFISAINTTFTTIITVSEKSTASIFKVKVL